MTEFFFDFKMTFSGVVQGQYQFKRVSKPHETLRAINFMESPIQEFKLML